MKTITQNLQKELKAKLKSADEVWIAVALITNKGLEFLQTNLPLKAKQHFILGIDLPSDINALKSLNKQQYSSDIDVHMFTKQEFYHPKLYLIKSKGKYTAYVGSANCTYNGLHSNIEMSFIIEDQMACKEILYWYEGIKLKSFPLTTSFIKEYEFSYRERLQRKKLDETQAKKDKENIEKDNAVFMHSRKALIAKLKRYRKHKNYKTDSKERWGKVEKLRESLDFPTFKKIDVDEFYNIWALGHLIPIPKPTILGDLPRFRRMLKVLTDESIDIAIRYNRAFNGDLCIRGVGVGTITKILTIHNPELYSVDNGKIKGVLKDHGIEFPRGLSPGEKYKASNLFLQKICEDTGIEDLAILDFYLYMEAENKD